MMVSEMIEKRNNKKKPLARAIAYSVVVFSAMLPTAMAGPQGGAVVGGSGTINVNGNTTSIQIRSTIPVS